MNRHKLLNSRRLSVAGFSFLFTYILSFQFEGQVLYSLLDMHGADADTYILVAIIAHFAGLFTCGLFIKSQAAAKNMMLAGMGLCLAATLPFFFAPSSLWLGGLIISGYFSGCSVAVWGFFLKAFTPENRRIKSCADVLIYSNLLMIGVNVVAVNRSTFIGLSLAILCLVIGMAFIWMLPADQEQTNLKGENTVIDEIWDEVPDLNYYEIRRILAQFLFYGDDMYKLVEDLSGGERGRLSLLKLMTSNANFLLMDEPTNHLDIDSKEVLEDSLINYEGTVLVVSHDRYFLNKVVNKIYDLSEEGTFEYLGNYDYYLEKKAELEEPNDKETTSKTKTQINAEKKKEREQIRDRQQREKAIRDLEEKIFMHENEIHELETKLCQPSTYTDNFLIISLNEKLNIRKKELQDLYTLWEEFIDN
jgi:energy-coupling factor transporter ATP-binding protein EcfA2